MSLTQKLKQSGTALTLAGSLLLGGSGCTPLSVLGGALIVAQSNRDAARIRAEANESQVVYVKQPTPTNYLSPGIIINMAIDLNKNNIAESGEPIVGIEKGVYNNSVIFFWALKDKYFGHKFRSVLSNEVRPLADETIILNDETHQIVSKVKLFGVGIFKNEMERIGAGSAVRGIQRYKMEYFKDDEKLPSDSKTFFVDFDRPYPN